MENARRGRRDRNPKAAAFFGATLLLWVVSVVFEILFNRRTELLPVVAGLCFFQAANQVIHFALSRDPLFVNTAVSLLHSTITSISVVTILINEWMNTCLSEMFDHSQLFSRTWLGAYPVVCFSCGYFAYDQWDMLRYQLYSGWIPGILVHHLVLLVCFTLALYRNVTINYLILTLICEFDFGNMRSFYKSFQVIESYFTNTKSKIINYNSVGCNPRQVCLEPYAAIFGRGAAASFCQEPVNYSWKEFLTFHNGTPRGSSSYRFPAQELFKPYKIASALQIRCVTTTPNTEDPVAEDACSVIPDTAKRIKFKRPDKTARHIMQILDKEAVQTVKTEREIPDIKPGHIIQLKVEVPENKRRISTLKGIVIARRNAGLNTTFRLRRLVAGIGVESVFPLYSPNIKEFKILDKKEVRRAKLYYLRERMNPLRD